MDDCPTCYGKPESREECQSCEWRKSCRVFYELPPADPPRHPRHVSYEAMTGGNGIGGDDASTLDGDSEAQELFTADDMAVLLRLLLSLDDYELRIMQNVVHGRYSSTSELARVFGISKQAMHRKLEDACFRHPEMAALLGTHLRRCRRVLACRKARPNQRGVKDDRQMEMKF